MTPEEFKRQYIASLGELPPELDLQLDEFCDFDLSEVATLKIEDADKAILSVVGLPRSAPSYLHFGSSDLSTFPYVNELCELPKEFSRYRVIGGNGYGDVICLDEALVGRVVYLNHDLDNKVIYINKNIRTLAQSLCYAWELNRDKDLAAFQRKIAEIDPDAIKDGAHWSQG